MDTNRDEQLQLEFFESELDLCHAFLDVAGPKPLPNVRAKVLQGYETVLHWIESVRDPGKFATVCAKLDRLRERLLASPVPATVGRRDHDFAFVIRPPYRFADPATPGQ